MQEEIKNVEKKKDKKINYVFVIIGVIIVVVLLAYLAIKLGVGGKLIGSASKNLPIPAAKVNGKTITNKLLDKNYTALKNFYTSQQGKEEGVMSDSDIKKMALDRLIENEIIALQAKKYNIKVVKEDIEKEYKIVLADYKAEADFKTELKDLYNWGIEDFKKEVLESSLYYDKLRNSYLFDSKIDPSRKQKSDEAKKKADEALAELRKGTDFATLAKAKSEDESTKDDGGDLGFFGRGEMLPEFEEAAFKLKDGEISNVVRTEEGYHIIKLEKRKGSGDKEEVQARHVLFMVEDNFDDWFLNQKKVAKVKIYVSGISWDAKEGAIAGLSESAQGGEGQDMQIENVNVEPVK